MIKMYEKKLFPQSIKNSMVHEFFLYCEFMEKLCRRKKGRKRQLCDILVG